MTSAARVWEIVGINDPVEWPLVGVDTALGRDPVAWAILNPEPLWSGTRLEMTGTARVAVLAAARADGSFRASGRSRAAIAVSGQVLRSIPLTGAAAITTDAAGRAERGRGLLLTGAASIALVAAGAASRASLMTGAAVISFTATGSAASYTDATGKARIAFGAAGWMRRGSTLSGTASASVTAEAANRRARPLTGAAGLSVAASGAAERVITASGEAAVAFVTEGKASRARSLGGSAALAAVADGVLRRGRAIGGAAAVSFSAAGQVEKDEPSGWSISDLFPAAGMWFDISDHSTLWEDHDGTIPAEVGGPVRRISDKSGNGYDLIAQGSGVATLSVENGRSYIQNANFRWEAPSAVGLLRNVDAATAMVASAPGSTSDAIIFFTVSNSGSGRFDLRYVDGDPRIGGAGQYPAVYQQWREVVPDPAVLEGIMDYAGGAIHIAVDGGEPKTSLFSGSAPTPDNDSMRVAWFGSASSGSPFTGRFYGGFIIPRLLTAEERAGALVELSRLHGAP